MRIVIKIVSGTRRENVYFFQELHAGTHRACRRRNTEKFFGRAERRVMRGLQWAVSNVRRIVDCDWSISYSYSLIHTATAHCRPRITLTTLNIRKRHIDGLRWSYVRGFRAVRILPFSATRVCQLSRQLTLKDTFLITFT